MRGFLMLAVAALAACGKPHDPGPGANDQAGAISIPANTGEAAAPTPKPPPPATATAIPAAMIGVYDASIEACGRPSDARLTVSPTELRFHESIGTVRGVVVLGSDSVSVEADYQGEGERWRSVRELRLGRGGSELTISGDGTSLARVRCPAGIR